MLSKTKRRFDESDILIFYLSQKKGYHELLELYSIISSQDKCKYCKKDNKVALNVLKEILETFGGSDKFIRMPKPSELSSAARDIKIYKTLSSVKHDKEKYVDCIHSFMEEFNLSYDMIYKIENNVTNVINKLLEHLIDEE